MDCPQCGYAQAPPGARFCPSCGQTLPQPLAPVTQIQVTQPVEHVEDGGTVTGVSIGRVIGTVVIAADEQTEARRRRDLRILLNKVKEFWVDGVLQRSVQGAGLIELDKTLQPEAVEQPWEGTVPGAEPAALALPPGKAIVDVFQELDHALLVLDGAGAGKTISLLELARQTIGRAERDPLQPVPVVLNLSS
ncbi:MAG: zinc ribbon domain-containing protein, partial [Chloroflexi bacterium]